MTFALRVLERSIAIKSVAPDGQIDAMYFNPSELPFMKAQATREGTTLRAFFALQAGGYAGSTYNLTYDSASDRLNGVYYQAVVKQSNAWQTLQFTYASTPDGSTTDASVDRLVFLGSVVDKLDRRARHPRRCRPTVVPGERRRARGCSDGA